MGSALLASDTWQVRSGREGRRWVWNSFRDFLLFFSPFLIRGRYGQGEKWTLDNLFFSFMIFLSFLLPE